jgi:hypothetical protein
MQQAVHSLRAMHTNRRLPIVVGILTTIVLAACGGGTPATSGPGGPAAASGGLATQAPGAATQAPGGGEAVDACALLTAADIEAVTTLAATSMTPGPQGGVFPSGCLWVLGDESSVVPPEISLGVLRPGGKDYYERYFATMDDNAGYKPIDGLGDVAVDAEFGAVHVVSGDTFFQVQYIGAAFGTDDTSMATELARRVVANLGG